jgi:copper(I)-binding protein
VTRSMLPRLRMSAAGFAASAAVAAGLLLSGCGAGQVTQTENQNPPVSGVNVDSEDGKVQLRNVSFEYGSPAGYETGQTVKLHVRIFNQNLEPIRLIGVATDIGAVVIAGKGVTAPAPPPTSAPPSSASGSASGAPSGSASGSASASASGSASATPSPTPTGPATNPTIDVEIPVRGIAVLDPTLDRYLQIIGLTEELTPGDTVEVTFRFNNGVSITTPVPIAVPMTPPARSPMQFEGGEGH